MNIVTGAPHYALGRPIGQNQGIQFPIARAHVNVTGPVAGLDVSRSEGVSCPVSGVGRGRVW